MRDVMVASKVHVKNYKCSFMLSGCFTFFSFKHLTLLDKLRLILMSNN